MSSKGLLENETKMKTAIITGITGQDDLTYLNFC